MFILQTIDQENESRRRLEQAVALAAIKKEDQVVLRNKTNQKKQQVSLNMSHEDLSLHRTNRMPCMLPSLNSRSLKATNE